MEYLYCTEDLTNQFLCFSLPTHSWCEFLNWRSKPGIVYVYTWGHQYDVTSGVLWHVELHLRSIVETWMPRLLDSEITWPWKTIASHWFPKVGKSYLCVCMICTSYRPSGRQLWNPPPFVAGDMTQMVRKPLCHSTLPGWFHDRAPTRWLVHCF